MSLEAQYTDLMMTAVIGLLCLDNIDILTGGRRQVFHLILGLDNWYGVTFYNLLRLKIRLSFYNLISSLTFDLQKSKDQEYGKLSGRHLTLDKRKDF